MADKLMPSVSPVYDTQNYPFYRLKIVVETLNNQLNESTNQNSQKSPKLLFKNFGD